jgi:O-6-methylguanine DNA methyltransferase
MASACPDPSAALAYNSRMTIDLAVVEFALGSFRASVDDGVVRGATFDLTPQPPRRDRSGVHDVLTAYFDGDVGALDSLRVGARGTPFQHDVWEQLRMIPVGTTISYGELARRIGRPQAQRAVGAANGSNPIALIVPCHRVIRTGGALGGYAFGLECKRWLLAHEAPATPLFGEQLFHGHARDDRGAVAIEDVVETVAGDRQAVIA